MGERRLLCEGWNPNWRIEKKEQVAVKLPQRIFEREGLPTSMQPVMRTRVTAQIQEADSQNENGRRYPSQLWDRILANQSEFVERLNNRDVLAEVEHPESGNTHLGRVSHLWERVWRDGCKIMGECIILKTPEGQKLDELLAVGHPLGFSSRGRGETFTASDGIEEVREEDYFLDTFDAVAKPSVTAARTQSVHSGQESFRPADHRTESIRGDQTMTAPAGIGAAAQFLGRCESTMAQVLESLGNTQDLSRLVEAQASVSGLLAEMGATPVPDGLREPFAEARGKLQSTAQTIKARIAGVKDQPRPARRPAQATAGKGQKNGAAAVIETLMERNKQLTERLRRQQRPVVDDQRFEVSIQLGEELLREAKTLKRQKDALQERYDAAIELLEQITTQQKGAKTKARIQAALQDSLIRSNPAAKALIEACRTPGEVDQAITLINGLVRRRPTRNEPLPRHGVGGGRNGTLSEMAPRPRKQRFSNTVFGALAEREANNNGLNG